MILRRIMEFLPLALVLGTTVSALRHREMADIQRAAVGNFVRIVLWLGLGAAALEIVLRVFFRD